MRAESTMGTECPNESRRGSWSTRLAILLVGLMVASATVAIAPSQASAATQVCASTSERTSTYTWILGIRWYRHEARGYACRSNGQVVSAEARTNRIVKIGIAIADWTDTQGTQGTAWSKHYVAAGVSDGEVSHGGIKLPVNISKKHEFDFDYYVQNGILYNRYSSSSWYW